MAQATFMRRVGIKTCDILDDIAQQYGGRSRLPFLPKDLYNKVAAECRKHINAIDTDSEGALGYLTALAIRDDYFFCRYRVNDEHRLHSLFWADDDSRRDYALLGEAIVFDTTYRTNTYNKPLLIILGVNHHTNSAIYGVALLSDETIESFT